MSRMDRPASAIIAGWWQFWGTGGACVPGLQQSQQVKIKRTAKKLGLSIDELRKISIKAYHTSNLLPLRMLLLHLNRADVARSDPELIRELEAACKLCDVKSRCTRDIIQDAANPQWQEYCLNAPILRAMQAGTYMLKRDTH